MAQAVDLMFRAFSDPTRLRILHLLAERETCVGDLVGILDVPQPTASRHLSYLRRAGLVIARRDGRWCHYALAPAKTRFHGQLLSCLASCFGAVPELRRDRARARQVRRGGGCCAPARSTR